MITEDYVSFETAKLLKEKGFEQSTLTKYLEPKNEHQYDIYGDTISAPTLQMACKWLREKYYVISIFPRSFYLGQAVSSYTFNIWADDNLEIDGYEDFSIPAYKSYEEACEAAIKYTLENLI